jgi:hypothetical protein
MAEPISQKHKMKGNYNMVELNEKQCADIEKIDTPEKKEQESAQVEKRTERKQKKAISDYRKSLISIAEVVKLTQMPAWSRIVEKLETDMKIADGGLHDGKKRTSIQTKPCIKHAGTFLISCLTLQTNIMLWYKRSRARFHSRRFTTRSCLLSHLTKKRKCCRLKMQTMRP